MTDFDEICREGVLEDSSSSRTPRGQILVALVSKWCGLGLESYWPWPCPQGPVFTLQPNITVFLLKTVTEHRLVCNSLFLKFLTTFAFIAGCCY